MKINPQNDTDNNNDYMNIKQLKERLTKLQEEYTKYKNTSEKIAKFNQLLHMREIKSQKNIAEELKTEIKQKNNQYLNLQSENKSLKDSNQCLERQINDLKKALKRKINNDNTMNYALSAQAQEISDLKKAIFNLGIEKQCTENNLMKLRQDYNKLFRNFNKNVSEIHELYNNNIAINRRSEALKSDHKALQSIYKVLQSDHEALKQQQLNLLSILQNTENQLKDVTTELAELQDKFNKIKVELKNKTLNLAKLVCLNAQLMNNLSQYTDEFKSYQVINLGNLQLFPCVNGGNNPMVNSKASEDAKNLTNSAN